MYVCIYVLSERVVRDHSCGGMIAYAGECHDEIPSLMWNQVGRLVMKNI